MQQFSYQAELKKIVESKQLVEISFSHEQDIVAYILRASDEFITIAEVSASTTLLAVSTYRLSEVELIKTESLYLDRFSPQVTDDSLYQRAQAAIAAVEDCSFDSFLKAFVHTEGFVEVIKENGDSLQGRVLEYDDKVILLEEYYTQSDRRFARSYINRNLVYCLAVDTPRLRILTKSLAGKRL